MQHTTPTLRLRPQFEALLSDYKPAPQSLELLTKTPLVLLNAPSGAGRNTVINELVKTGRYHFLISDTTRPPRYNDGVLEQSGGPYWFKTEQQVLDGLRAGRYIVPELIHGQQVSGINITEFERAQSEQKIAINEVEIGGIKEALTLKSDTIAIILLPPSFDEWLARMDGRTQATQDERMRRLQTAVRIFTEALAHPGFCFVVNHELAKTVSYIDNLVQKGGKADPAHQSHGRMLVKQLLSDTLSYLELARS